MDHMVFLMKVLPQKPIRVSYETTHNELLEKMYEITGFDRQRFEMKIICRYPACREFIPVPISDDESLHIVFDVAQQPDTNCMELYLEREPVRVDNRVNITAPVCNANRVNIKARVQMDNQANVKTPACNVNQLSVDGAEHNANPNSILDPGPCDKSVLVLQDQHRSEAIWAGEDPGVLTCRQRLGTMMREWQLDQRIRQFVIQSGFYQVYRIGFIQLDWPLVTALVERWRQETHTFHFAVGESTVTLQDVAVLLGLRIDGHPVTGSADLQWDDLCEELLGVRPDPSVLRGSTLKLSWLRAYFQQPPSDADNLTLQCYARAYILGLLGSLFADKSGSDVHLIFLPLLKDFEFAGQLSWGSAILAHLYRELCRASRKGTSEISGPLMLLQLWAWERLHIGRPERFVAQEQDPIVLVGEAVGNLVPIVESTIFNQEPLPADPLGCRWKSPVIRRDNPQRALMFYRDQLDQQIDDQMIWQPYTSELLMSLPDICVRDQHVWRTIAPLICFDIVEWHRPDRVLRQFGLKQGIPLHCDTVVKIHAVDRRGRHHYNWKSYHEQYVKLWATREKNIATAEPECPIHYHDPYMVWYRSITRRLITPLTQRPHKRFQAHSGTTHLLVHSLAAVHNQCTTALEAFTHESARQSLTDIRIMCARVLEMIGETQHLEARPAATPAQPTTATAPRSPLQVNDMEGLPEFIRKEVAPPSASMPAKTRAPSIRGRGRAKGRVRGLGTQEIAIEPVTTTPHSAAPQVIASATAPSHGNDIHMEEPATLNLEDSGPLTASLHPVEVDIQKEKEPAYPLFESQEGLSSLTQVDTSHETRRKKPKPL